MAILDTVKKFGLRVKTATGYITYKLGSEFVQMDNGKDLQTAFDDLNGELTELNSKIPELIGQAGYNGVVPIGDIPAGTELLVVAECAISAGSRSSFSWSVIKQESGTGHYMDGFMYSQNYRGAVGITVTPVSVSFWDDWTQFLDGQTSISKSSNSIRVYSK